MPAPGFHYWGRPELQLRKSHLLPKAELAVSAVLSHYLHRANRPVGLMDKASASGAGDSRFESWAGHAALPPGRHVALVSLSASLDCLVLAPLASIASGPPRHPSWPPFRFFCCWLLPCEAAKGGGGGRSTCPEGKKLPQAKLEIARKTFRSFWISVFRVFRLLLGSRAARRVSGQTL